MYGMYGLWGGERVKLTRDCEATAVPMGYKMMLRAGTAVEITQALGGTYTVLTERGDMVRIAGTDADALGMEPVVAPHQGISAENVTAEQVEQMVWEQLRTCYDPEIPVNIADLGLIYGCDITPLPHGGYSVDIRMTLTAPGCGMGDVLALEVDDKVRSIPGVKEASVRVVFDPPWDMSMMPESARLQLGLM